MQITEIKRNVGFDFLRYVCAFLVICIHTSFAGKKYVMLLARVAVPIFFMITGYFYTSVQKKGRDLFQIRKILTIALLGNVIYCLWELLVTWASSKSLIERIVSWTDGDIWLNFLLVNVSPFRSHLWYLSAILYVLIIVRLLKDGRKKIYHLIPVLLGINLVLGNYSKLIFGKALPLEYSRNFLFLGLPCFLLGDALYQYKNDRQLKNRTLIALLVASLVVSLLELVLLTHWNVYENQDLSVGNILTSFAIFSLVQNNPLFFERNWCKKIAWMGKNLSLGLYVFHSIIRMCVEKVIRYLSIVVPLLETFTYYTMPIMMLVIDTCAIYVLLFVCKKLQKQGETKLAKTVV